MIKYWKPNGRIEKITKGLKKRVNRLVRETLKNIKVEVTDEFDRNFERDAFFNEKWARRRRFQQPAAAQEGWEPEE